MIHVEYRYASPGQIQAGFWTVQGQSKNSSCSFKVKEIKHFDIRVIICKELLSVIRNHAQGEIGLTQNHFKTQVILGYFSASSLPVSDALFAQPIHRRKASVNSSLVMVLMTPSQLVLKPSWDNKSPTYSN
jgi:hypothetical protein